MIIVKLCKTENFEQYVEVYTFEKLPTPSEFQKAFHLFKGENVVNLNIKACSIEVKEGGDEIDTVELHNLDIDKSIMDSMYQKIKTHFEEWGTMYDDNLSISLKITIIKNDFLIFCSNSLLNFINNTLTFSQVIYNLNDFESHNFNCTILEQETNHYIENPITKKLRSSRLMKIEHSVILVEFPKPKFIPEDLNYSLNNNSQPETLEIMKILENIKGITSLVFLSNYCSIKKNNTKSETLHLKIENTNTVEKKLSLENFDYFTSSKIIDDLFSIYLWVYEDDNLNKIHDRLEFARHQLSKNITIKEDKIHLKTEHILKSLQSMYKIYLKENVEQYIHTTNKIAEINANFLFKQDEIIDNFNKSLKSNLTLVLGLFLTLIVYNNLSAQRYSIFSSENFVLIIGFILFSIFVCIFSYKKVTRNLRSVNNYFSNQKKIYSNLLSKEDLEELFSDKYTLDVEENVKKERLYATICWVTILIFILISAIYFTFCQAPESINVFTQTLAYI